MGPVRNHRGLTKFLHLQLFFLHLYQFILPLRIFGDTGHDIMEAEGAMATPRHAPETILCALAWLLSVRMSHYYSPVSFKNRRFALSRKCCRLRRVISSSISDLTCYTERQYNVSHCRLQLCLLLSNFSKIIQ